MKTIIQKSVLFFGITLMTVFFSNAQVPLKIKDAFSRSYEFEAEKNYFKAMMEIANMYDENSYEHNIRLGLFLA